MREGDARLEESYRRFTPRGYAVVAIAVPSDNPNRVADFARRAGLSFTVGLDLDGTASRAFGDVQVTPTSFLIGKDGRILRKYVGEPNWADLDAAVEKALGSSSRRPPRAPAGRRDTRSERAGRSPRA